MLHGRKRVSEFGIAGVPEDIEGATPSPFADECLSSGAPLPVRCLRRARFGSANPEVFLFCGELLQDVRGLIVVHWSGPPVHGVVTTRQAVTAFGIESRAVDVRTPHSRASGRPSQ
jgi:hypothetical protein